MLWTDCVSIVRVYNDLGGFYFGMISDVRQFKKAIIRFIIKSAQIQLKMLQLQKKWKHLLARYKMDRPQILPHSITYFQLLVDTLCEKLATLLYKHPRDSVSHGLQQLLTVIDNSVDQITVGCVVKKMALMHAILDRMDNKQSAQLIISIIQKHIKKIIKEDVAMIVQEEPKKREGSITKIKDFVRKLSGSKERSSSIRGKMGIEKQKEKGAVGQLLSKIITPFCMYMMKVVDDFDTFWKIKHSAEIEKVLIWKMVNWSKLLGKIILQVNRLGLYFKEDMLSLSIYLNYLISMDISKYYDVLKKYVLKESQRWRTIIQIEDLGQSRENEWIGNSELRELKELIEQWRQMKQKLHCIYSSILLQKWLQYFPKPEQFTLIAHNTIEEVNVDFILQCLQPKRKSKSFSRQPSSLKYFPVSDETRQTAVSTQELKDGILLFDNVSENVLVSKLQGFNLTKSRLSKVQQFQKQKLFEHLLGF